MNEYKAIYHHLNLEELNFCFIYPKTLNSNLFLNTKEKISLQKSIISTSTYLLNLDTKNTGFLFEYKSQINLISMSSVILLKEIQKINPRNNALLIGKLIKLIEEKLIYNYINLFMLKIILLRLTN